MRQKINHQGRFNLKLINQMLNQMIAKRRNLLPKKDKEAKYKPILHMTRSYKKTLVKLISLHKITILNQLMRLSSPKKEN